jgi:hypothetical protein
VVTVFSMTVHPCKITKFSTSPSKSDFTYVIGTPGSYFGAFSHVQINDCDY